jgi:phosphatidylserine/phosphatidylglycerophosphate/cardiolipin synthase-like enzyme
MTSSANPAETGISRSWNNTYTTVNDKTIYDANVDNFNDMLPDKTNTDYSHTVASGVHKEYFFPRAGSTKKSDTLYNTRPVNGLYVHNKVILIYGVYQGVTNQKIVYTTSQNLTMTSLRESNEVMLRIPTSSAYQAYWANFEEIKSHSVRVGSSAAANTTAGVDSASKTPVLSDNAPDPDE